MSEAIVISSAILAVALVVSAWLYSRKSQAMFPLLPPLPPLPPEANPVVPSGIPVTSETPIEVGSRVLANWEGSWYRAEVLALERNGNIRIHYVGWESYWDASVRRNQLQVDLSESMDD